MRRVPLYRQVQQELLESVRALAPGDLIPTEPELERTYGVSRATIRKAVGNLVQEGVLERRQGSGTRVKAMAASQDFGRVYSWTAEMASKGLSVQTRALVMRRIPAGKTLASELGIGIGEDLVMMSRVRLVENVPIVIMVNYLRERYVPGLLDRGLTEESLYQLLADSYGLDLASGEEVIRARNATAFEAAALGVDEGAALLHVRRRTLLRSGVPFELVDMTARGDKYQYFARLAGGFTARTIS